MNMQEVVHIMRYGSREDKMSYLNFLDIAFDVYNRKIENANAVVEVLIDSALASKDDGLTDEILEVICSAQISQDLHDVDYSKIANNLNNVSEKFLPRYIDILGNTGNTKYLPDVLRFKNDKNRNVQQAVKDALIELRAPEYN